MDIEKVLNGVLSKTLNIDDGKIAELFKDGENELTENEVISKILNLDVDRIKNIKSENEKEKFQEGYKKSKREVLETLETELKEKYGIESSNTGIDLVNEIVNVTSKPSDITEDAIRRSKLYLDLEANAKKEKTNLLEEYQNKIDEIKSTYEGEKVFSTVNKNAMSVLKALNPILPANQEIANNQINAFLDKFKEFNFEIQDDRVVVMDKDKKVIQDQHGNTRNFDDIVKERASSFWEFQANNGGSGSGNNPQGGNGGQGARKAPKTLEELTNIMNDKSIDGAEKLLIAEEFEKNQ